jgi:hypothetical protein
MMNTNHETVKNPNRQSMDGFGVMDVIDNWCVMV